MTSVRMVDPERANPLTKIGLIISWQSISVPSVNDSKFPRAFQKPRVLETILLTKWSPVGTWDVFVERIFVATPGNFAALVNYTQKPDFGVDRTQLWRYSKAFVWTKSAVEILEKVNRVRSTLNSIQSN